ncbi:MAG: exosortase VPDSG-CTERM-specific [Verrucomicrobiales bacterium]|nr:exosortase VPDSG-CTERM-specific [Verrucomicrobiales bacterium]
MHSLEKAPTPGVEPSTSQFSSKRTIRGFGFFVLALSLVFCKPLYSLLRLAFSSDLYSHIPLIPFISAYLVWTKRKPANLPGPNFSLTHKEPSTVVIFLTAFGSIFLLIYWALLWKTGHLPVPDSLALTMSAYLCFVWGGFLLFFGKHQAKALAFPLAFLAFMVPFPTFVHHAIEVFFQHTSAEAANVLIGLSGTPFLRDGLVFTLPGISLQVAEECSGIRSSLVLFVTSLVAGHMFLTSPWRKGVLAFFVIPLGIMRNGFRIFTIAMLCAHLDPSWIDSPIHHRGGPLFFVASLVPFFAFLVWLRKSEVKRQKIVDRGRIGSSVIQ